MNAKDVAVTNNYIEYPIQWAGTSQNSALKRNSKRDIVVPPTFTNKTPMLRADVTVPVEKRTIASTRAKMKVYPKSRK
jgi:hypothetical protein